MAEMDWQLTCRICLESGDMVSLFDWDENNEMLAEKYNFCCGIKINKYESLPTLICLNCVDHLTEAYKFKQQCISSNETLKECLDEFMKSAASAAENDASDATKGLTETITIKQENGVLLQYELPVEHEPSTQWSKTVNRENSVITKAPEPKKRGRPRKYPNESGQIVRSPYVHKKVKQIKDEPSLTTLLASGSLDVKEEPQDVGITGDDGSANDQDDPDFMPDNEMEALESDEDEEEPTMPKGRPRGRPRKSIRSEDDLGEDVLLKETIMAYSDPIPEHLLNPKLKSKPNKKPTIKRKYVYDKSHTCETCGTSFTSNATLQAHIRRHLGIKPFVCSVCGYASVLNEALKRHMLKHTGEKPYKCRICDRKFADYGTRQKHERLHMGIRPYQCSLCGKSFTYSYVLANHMLTHTGEKKYTCTPCNKKFTKAHHLKYHNKVHHKEAYLRQQMEKEAKQMRQQITVSNISGIFSGQIIDNKLRIVQATDNDETVIPEMEMQEADEGDDMIEKSEDMGESYMIREDDKETQQAVDSMQGVIINDDFCIEDDEEDADEKPIL